jgi:hypothetical protein
MSDELTPAEEQETPAPEETASVETPVVDWEKRYSDLRSEFDRRNQQYTDPEYRQQLFGELASEYGYQIPQDEAAEQYTYEDPTDQLRAELMKMREEFQSYTQQQAHQQQVAIAEAYAESRLDDLGVQDDRKREWIATRATAMPAIQYEGHVVPDIEAAYQEYQELVKAEQQAWAQSKQAPHVAASGQENTGVPAWSDDPRERAEQRIAWATEQHMLRQQQ